MGHDGALSKKVADDPASERTLDSCMGARSTAVVIEVAGRFRRRGALRWSDGPIAASEIYEEAPMEDAPVLVERRAGYRVITLNRPRQLNAVNEAMQQALKRALAEAEEDCDCRALLLTGAGRAFCAGQDLRERMTADGKTTVLGSTLDTYYNPLVRKLRTLLFPVVAAVNGVAAGAGANIALACDIVLAAHLVLAAAGRPRSRPRACAYGRAAPRGQGRILGPHLENVRRPRPDGAGAPALRPVHSGADGRAGLDQARPR
jgi:hypothetical protein